MKIDEDKSFMRSTTGSICTVILFLVIGAYAYTKTDAWLMKKNVDIMAARNEEFFDEEYVFGYEQGLNFAIAFTAYDGATEPILDPKYGKVVFNHFSWGDDANGDFFSLR